jgi:host factor-I protein
MSGETDLQTSYLAHLRRENQRVVVWLVSGRRLVGRIKGYDRFTILLDLGGGDQLIFKHAVASVGPAKEGPRDAPRDRDRGPDSRRDEG